MKHGMFVSCLLFCSFETGTKVKISGQHFLTCQYSEKWKSPCIKVVSVHSCQTIFLKGGKQQSRWAHSLLSCHHWEEAITTSASEIGIGSCMKRAYPKHRCNHLKKVHGYFQFHVYKQRMQPTVTSRYFLEGGFCLLLQNGCSHPYLACQLHL